jgi:hypothetical protein
VRTHFGNGEPHLPKLTKEPTAKAKQTVVTVVTL